MSFNSLIKRSATRLLTVFLGFCWFNPVAFATGPIPIFDSHSHYKTEDSHVYDGKDILALMDRENITHMVIVGEPPERVQNLYKLAPHRIIPFLGLYGSYKEKADWMLNDRLPEKLEELLKKGEYKGIGEIHLFKKDRHNKNFKRILSLADKHDLPVLFHGDAEVIDQIFEMFPEMTVIWAHLGTKPAPVFLKRMLDRYPDNLYVDTSVRDEMIMRDGQLLPRWRNFFISYSHRVLVGIDTFYTPRWENIDKVTQRIRHWLSLLPDSVARKLAYENAQKVFLSQE